MYDLEIKPTADRTFKKLAKKDREQLKRVFAKVEEILDDPYRFKPLKKPMEGLRRVHVGSFVLVYEIDEDRKVVTIMNYEHHDKVYKG